MKTVFKSVQNDNSSDEMIEKIKKKYHSTDSRAMKYKLLSILPESWSIRDIEREIGATVRMAAKSKTLTKKYGILFDMQQKAGSKTLPAEVVDRIQHFYCSDEVSRICPGKRDYKKVLQNGQLEKVQRRLLLLNLNELYEQFKKEFPNDKVSFSKFASLRPPQCLVTIDAHGIHSTCVCKYHQDAKLIVESLHKFCGDDFKTYHQYLDKMLCDQPEEKCYIHMCTECPGKDAIYNLLSKKFEDEELEEFNYFT